MKNQVVALLGASDPEMQAIREVLSVHGVPVHQAIGPDGRSVHPGTAYQATGANPPLPDGARVLRIECDGPVVRGHDVIVIDHHRPGDPGYGQPPEQFWLASSIGQVYRCLAVADAIPREHVLAAAADHCLAYAYRGRCPDVDPDELMQWRVASRAIFQRRRIEDVLAEVEAARAILRQAPRDETGIADLRQRPAIPELPEAAAREGIPVMAQMRERDGRTKVVLQCASPEQVQLFISGALVAGLEGVYGDPERGFAGGYLS